MYYQELIKIGKKNRKSDISNDDLYKPPIKWFHTIHYIMKISYLKKKEPTSNLVSTHNILFQYYFILFVCQSPEK